MKNKKNLLFICTENLHRSPAAEQLFEDSDNYEAKSAGVSPMATIKVTKKALDWADLVFVMEDIHKKYIMEKFPQSSTKEIINLKIPDRYRRNDPALVKLLKEKLSNWVEI